MLDAKDYPKAFIEHGNLYIEFTDAVEKSGEVLASVSIRQKWKFLELNPKMQKICGYDSFWSWEL